VVKCLVRFHPDEPEAQRREQELQLRTLQDAVQASGHELLLEVIPPRSLPHDERTVLRAVARLYDAGIAPEWWKLEPMAADQWRELDRLVAERDPHCRGVVILGLNARIDELAEAFREAATSRTCRGFVVGRTIFQEPSRAWLAGRIDDAALVSEVRSNFEALVRLWREARGGATADGAEQAGEEVDAARGEAHAGLGPGLGLGLGGPAGG